MSRSPALVFASAALAFACATSDAPPLSREETQVDTFRARVAAVDLATRVVTLADASGNQMSFRADEAVKNLPQVKVGDELVGQRMESLAIELRDATAEEQAAPASVAEMVATAEPGQKPAGLFVRQIKAVYTVESVDKPAGGGMLRDASGNTRFVKARDPAVLERVKAGDTLVVTLTEAIRIEVLAP